MGFWIFMLIACELIPFVMVVFGIVFSKTAPKNINIVFGYRTVRSMKNEDTWAFAHKHIGRTWLMMGIPMLVLSAVILVLVKGAGDTAISAVCTVLNIVQIVLLVAAIFPTERALEKTFDKNGNRK